MPERALKLWVVTEHLLQI